MYWVCQKFLFFFWGGGGMLLYLLHPSIHPCKIKDKGGFQPNVPIQMYWLSKKKGGPTPSPLLDPPLGKSLKDAAAPKWMAVD